MEKCPVLYLVVPCYNEEEVLPSTIAKLDELLLKMSEDNLVAPNSKAMYVDDGSKDDTWRIIQTAAKANSRVAGVKLAGNVGHQNALMAGLNVSKDVADIAISIDADLQDDIHVIPDMVRKYDEGYDIIYGVRNHRATDTWFKRTTALAFYRLMSSMGVKTVYNHADFRLMSRRAISQLCNYSERNLYLRGIVPLIGYKTTRVYYDRKEREAGESKYPLSKMLGLAVDGITSFSIKPVRMILLLGIVFLLIALVMFIYVMVRYVQGDVVAGWPSLMLSLWFVGGCLLVGLGVVGEYIGKIYIEAKRRPRYNIEQTV